MTGFADLRLNRLGYARIISKLRAGIEPALLRWLFAAGPTKLKLVREAGIEPARLRRGILSPACLPLSPLPHQACRRRELNSHGLSSPQVSKTCVSACSTTPATKKASADPNTQFRCGLSLLNSLMVSIEYLGAGAAPAGLLLRTAIIGELLFCQFQSIYAINAAVSQL